MDRPWHLLTLSAKTQAALDQLIDLYRNDLPEEDLADIAFSANTGRAHFPLRMTVLAQTKDELLRHLQTGDYLIGEASAKPKVAFIFSGDNGESNELMETSPVFKEAMERSHGLYEYALFELWKSWGVIPDYVAGEGNGDVIAAIASGIITLADGLKLIASKDHAQAISYSEPKIALISSWTGEPIRKEGLTADYWKPHDNVRNIPEEAFVIPLHSNWKDLLQTLAQLYRNGYPIDWKAFDKPYYRKKVSLPTYPFQRERYWVETLKIAVSPQKQVEGELVSRVSKSEPKPFLRTQLKEAHPSERKEILMRYLQQMVSKVLGSPFLNPELGFFDAGMDSLMAIELRNQIQSEFGEEVGLPGTLAFEYQTMTKIADYLIDTLFKEKHDIIVKEEKEIKKEIKRIENEVNSMSLEEISKFLKR